MKTGEQKLVDMLAYASMQLDDNDEMSIKDIVDPHIDEDWTFDQLYNLLANQGIAPKRG